MWEGKTARYQTGRQGFKLLRQVFSDCAFELRMWNGVYYIYTGDPKVKDFMNQHTYKKNPKLYYTRA